MALRQPRAGFAVYRTPTNAGDSTLVLDHPVKVTPKISEMKPAFDALREDNQRILTKSQFLELCPEVQDDIVDTLYNIFDQTPRNGTISYDEMCAFMMLAGDAGNAMEQLEALFPICDIDGDNVVEAADLRQVIKMLYLARNKSQDSVEDEVDKVMQEIMQESLAEMEDEKEQVGTTLTLMQFATWARSDQVCVQELRELLRNPIIFPQEDGPMDTWTMKARIKFDAISVEHPIVELDGDEMARILWQMIKEKLIYPFLDMQIDYYDLSITYRDETKDSVTTEAAEAIKKYNIGIKCPTIVPDRERILEFNLQEDLGNASATISEILHGTTFQSPIVIKNIPPQVAGWERPIHVGRLLRTEEYTASHAIENASGSYKFSVLAEDGDSQEELVARTFKPSSGGGVIVGMYSARESIVSFAECCFGHALSEGLCLFLSTKKTVLQELDKLYRDVFESLYVEKYKKLFEEKGLTYQHRRMDKLVAEAIGGSGGFIWACTSHDSDVLSALVAQGFGIPGLSISTLVCADGKTILMQATHGTVTKHWRDLRKGEKTSTNPIACIFSWSRGLAHRAKLDNNERLAHFSQALEESCIACVESGVMSKDLARRIHGPEAPEDTWRLTDELLNAIAAELRMRLNKPLERPDTLEKSEPLKRSEDCSSKSLMKVHVCAAGTSSVNGIYIETGDKVSDNYKRSLWKDGVYEGDGLHCCKAFAGCPAGWFLTTADENGMYFNPSEDPKVVPLSGWTSWTGKWSTPGSSPPPYLQHEDGT